VGSSYDKSTAVVVLPPVGQRRLRDRSLRHWLAQSDLVRMPLRSPLLAAVLEEIGRPVPSSGLAALRMWGQTGDRPTAWMAAAEPVYLEPRLDTLCLHVVDDLAPGDLHRLVDHLQEQLGQHSGQGFAQVGEYAYVTLPAAVATASVPAVCLAGERIDEYLPRQEGAAAYRQLVSEIEMALHEHPVNTEREAAGLPPVNAFWLWGGGSAPVIETTPIPPLFGDDALSQGYWHSVKGVCEPWPGSIGACLEQSIGGFVAVAPATMPAEGAVALLDELRAALRGGRLGSLVLRFRDGLRAEVRRSHALRVWRFRNTMLDQSSNTP
jgi:hypothetical protein